MLKTEGDLAVLQPYAIPSTVSTKSSVTSNEKTALLDTFDHETAQQKAKEEDPRKTMPWMFEKKHYIRAGYLPSSAGIKEALSISPSCHHNETVNIYSHLLAAGVFIYFLMSLLIRAPSYMTHNDILVTSIYAVGTTICFLFSALHHARGYKSQALHYWTHQFDIIGIISLMSGAAVPMIHYGLYLQSSEQHFYYISVPLIALGCCAALLVPQARSTPASAIRIFMFTLLALPGVAAILHGRYLFANSDFQPIALGWIALTAMLNASGAALYAAKIPEKYWRGFDIYGASHQIFHIVIVASSLVFWFGLSKTIKSLRHV